MAKLDNIQINSFNCAGVRGKRNRLDTFNWLKKEHKGITFLQETHSTIEIEDQWEKQWGGTIYYNHFDHKSRGVAIMIPKDLEPKFKFLSGQKDNEGRILLIDCELEDNHVTLINVYFPTKDDLKEQIKTLEKLRTLMEDYTGNNILMGGDFNTYLNPKLDKKSKRITETQSAYSKALNDFCEEFSFVDIWRVRNPDVMSFTRTQNCRGGAVLSRLDYWLVSAGTTYNIRKTDMDDGFESDHKIIFITLDLKETCKRGKGFWKFNNSLLQDKNLGIRYHFDI